MARETIGCIGMGHMGRVLAANLVQAGYGVVAHDAAGPGGAPEGSTSVAEVAEVARRVEVIVLSLPDGAASENVCGQIVRADDSRVTLVIDTSTIGVGPRPPRCAPCLRTPVWATSMRRCRAASPAPAGPHAHGDACRLDRAVLRAEPGVRRTERPAASGG